MTGDQVGLALRILDDVREVIERRAILADALSIPVPDFDAAREKARIGTQIVARIDALDSSGLPSVLSVTLGVAREYAALWARAGDWYWTIFDPAGNGLFGPFAATPYCGGFSIASACDAVRRTDLGTTGNCHRYLGALDDLAVFIDCFADRTRGQRERGIYMPRPAAMAAIGVIERLTKAYCDRLQIGADRKAAMPGFARAVSDQLDRRVRAAFARLRAVFDTAYLEAAPETVGLAQYPGGAEIYAALVKFHGSTDMSPEEVHAFGLSQMGQIRAEMKALRAEDGFEGDDHHYRAALDAHPDWKANGDADLEGRFQDYLDRISPHLPTLFGNWPRATCGVAPLPESMQAAVTFGYYKPPAEPERHGVYFFNPANLAAKGAYGVGSLAYHELVPGHHLHLALQNESLSLPWLRRRILPTAFTEGWAEYATSLADEIGMFRTPAERFGRLVAQAFLTCRLVVDTGVNAMGWSLEKARDYMRANSFAGEAEIRSETLRYACDIPGQGLAYQLGHLRLQALRKRQQALLGDRFSLSRFHDRLLEIGAVPLSLLEKHMELGVGADHIHGGAGC